MQLAWLALAVQYPTAVLRWHHRIGQRFVEGLRRLIEERYRPQTGESLSKHLKICPILLSFIHSLSFVAQFSTMALCQSHELSSGALHGLVPSLQAI